MITTTITTAPLEANTVAIWEDWNFEQDEAGDWIAEGVTDPIEAYLRVHLSTSGRSAWIEAGFTLEEAAKWLRDGPYNCTPEAAAAWRDAGHEPVAAFDWDYKKITLAEAATWITAGFTDSADAKDWRDLHQREAELMGESYTRLTPDEAAQWRDTGFTPLGAQCWFEYGPAEASKWFEAGFDFSEVYDWREAGFTPDEAAGWHQNRAFTSYFAKKWRDAGFNAKEARKWSAAGYYELAEALAAKAAGHNVPEIEEVEMDIADFTAF